MDRRAVPIKVSDSLIVSVPVKYIRYELLTCGKATQGIPMDGPQGRRAVSFDFFLPDFGSFTAKRLQESFDVNEVEVAYVVSWRDAGFSPNRPVPNSSDQLNNTLHVLADPASYRDIYGLRCYERRVLKNRMYCYSTQAGKGSKRILLNVEVPPFAPGVVNPQMWTDYFSKRYGGIEIYWRTNVKNLPHWREIDAQVWKFLAAWNVANTKARTKGTE